MMAVGPLMIEHRLIERVVAVMKTRLAEMVKEQQVDALFVDRAADFFLSYADHCHHGKEEDILFRALSEKPLAEEHRRTMNTLIEQHVHARKLVGELLLHKDKYVRGEDRRKATKNAAECIRDLTEFYPRHVQTEDKQFFLAAMTYLTEAEQKHMLEQFAEFDRKLIHDRYRALVEEMEDR